MGSDVMGYQVVTVDGTTPPAIVCARLPPEAVQVAWTKVAPFLRRALKESQGELTESAIRAGVAHSLLDVWVVLQGVELVGVLLTQVVEYPSALRSLQITLMSGSRFRVWMGQALDALLAFAKAERCSRLEAVGRRGLIKLLAPCGFEPSYYMVTREVVSDGQKRRR